MSRDFCTTVTVQVTANNQVWEIIILINKKIARKSIKLYLVQNQLWGKQKGMSFGKLSFTARPSA